MCPICDINCEKWNLNESCPYAQIVHFFDNYATVGYAVFMCVWNHLHLVIWRRQSARLLHHWNISEELDELFEISDRLHVIAKGRLSPSLDRAEATIERIGEWMSGLWDTAGTHHKKEETAHAAA